MGEKGLVRYWYLHTGSATSHRFLFCDILAREVPSHNHPDLVMVVIGIRCHKTKKMDERFPENYHGCQQSWRPMRPICHIVGLGASRD